MRTRSTARSRKSLSPIAALLAALLAAAPAAADHETAPHPITTAPSTIHCVDTDPGTFHFVTDVDGEPALGSFSAPAIAPTVLVVIGHGSTHTVESWRQHIIDLTEDYGTLNVAMEYARLEAGGDIRGMDRHPTDHHEGAEEQGILIPAAVNWPQKEGGEDLIAAAKRFQAECPSIQTTILVGVSMGAAMSGYAVSHLPAGDEDLFDYWVACEGVHNMPETYSEAKAIGDAAAGWIEAETGGLPAQVPNEYEERSNLLKTDAIETTGLERVIYLHAAYDGLVGYHQSRQMAQDLQIPFEFYTVTSRGEGPDGTTLPDHLIDAGDGLLAGHAGEWDIRALLMRATLKRVGELATQPLPDCGEYHVEEGATYPDVVFPPVATNDCSLIDPGLNGPPNAVDDDAVTLSGIPITIDVLANDSDPDGDPLTTIAATPGDQGSTRVEPDGRITYTPPDEGFTGDTFEYTVSDGSLSSDIGTVNLPEPGGPAMLAAGIAALLGLGARRERS